MIMTDIELKTRHMDRWVIIIPGSPLARVHNNKECPTAKMQGMMQEAIYVPNVLAFHLAISVKIKQEYPKVYWLLSTVHL